MVRLMATSYISTLLVCISKDKRNEYPLHFWPRHEHMLSGATDHNCHIGSSVVAIDVHLCDMCHIYRELVSSLIYS